MKICWIQFSSSFSCLSYPTSYKISPKKQCFDLLTNILYSKRQNGYTGSDLRIALIEINKLLHSLDVSSDIKNLLSTAVKISELLYSQESKRTPKSILQLYNCTWLGFIIMSSVKLFSQLLEKWLTWNFLACTYIPHQYEIVSLRSVNAERMFQQAKKIARNTTNRKPENVIPSILLRLQAKQIMGKLSLAYQASETEVKKVATTVKPCGGTTVSDYFVTHTSSWQHMYIYTCTCTYIHTHIRTYIHTYIHTYVRTNINSGNNLLKRMLM